MGRLNTDQPAHHLLHPHQPPTFPEEKMTTSYDATGMRTIRQGSGDLTFGQALDTAVIHARSIIDDGAATDPRMTEHLATLDAVHDAPVWTARQLESIGAVLALGAEYMTANGYADDPDYEEDAAAAIYLGTADQALAFLRDVALHHRLDEPTSTTYDPTTGGTYAQIVADTFNANKDL